MFRSYSAVYRFSFVHDDEYAHCFVHLYHQDAHLIVFSFQSDVFTANPSPALYAFCEYKNLFWIANLDEYVSTFIEDPMDTESTLCNLLELDCSDDEETEELAEIIRFLHSREIPMNSDNHPYEDLCSNLNEDDELPF